MANLYGLLNINDTDRVFVSTLGQNVVYDAIQEVLADHNESLNAAMSVFVAGTTSDYKFRFKLPGGGRLARLGGQAPSPEAKSAGGWDVALPLEGFGRAIGGNRVDWSYMSVQDLNRALSTIMIADINTVRYEILKALFNNTQRTFVDPLWGSLSVEPLANGDSVVYPPVLGTETEATDNHYLESGYLASAISDSNDPYETIRDELEEHFGTPTAGGEVVCFINNAETSKSLALTDMAEVVDRYVRPGDDQNIAAVIPQVPGRIIGRHTSGVWVSEWRWIPSGYILGTHLGAEKPLMMRVDPEDTGLPVGLAMVSEDERYPLRAASYEHRFGVGATNRLNGVMMELGNGGTYTVPSGY